MKPRLIAYVRPELHAKVAAAAKKPGLSQSAVVEMALKAFFSLSIEQERDAALIKRQDDMIRRLARIERDHQAHMEMTDIAVWFQLLFSPPMSGNQRQAAITAARPLHKQFRDKVAERLQPGRKLLGEALADAVFSEDDFVRLPSSIEEVNNG